MTSPIFLIGKEALWDEFHQIADSERIIASQPHHLNRAVSSAVKMTAPIDPAGIAESAFFHYAAGGGIVYEKVAQKRVKALFAEAVVNKRPQRLCTDSLVPIGPGNPVSRLGIVLLYADIALPLREIAHAADWFAGFFQLQRPHMVATEKRTDYFQTLFNGFMRFPTGPGANFRVRLSP